MCVRTCRIGQNVPERSPEADIFPMENQQPALQDVYDYSTIDGVQQKMLAVSGNPAYKFVPEHDQKSMKEDDPAYINMDIRQQEEVAECGKLRYYSTPGAAASDKWHFLFFLLQSQKVGYIPKWNWITHLTYAYTISQDFDLTLELNCKSYKYH